MILKRFVPVVFLLAAAGTSDTVLDLEGAQEVARTFLGHLKEGRTEAMYAMVDDFTRLRFRQEEFAARMEVLIEQYGAAEAVSLVEAQDGNPFYHVRFEVRHERSAVVYHFALSPSGSVVTFEVESVDGKKIEAPERPDAAEILLHSGGGGPDDG